jgi:DNA-binding transcriptional LysR family regulator
MNLNHLRSFLAIAEEASVTRAARRMGSSQPAVSKQLSDFEAALGVILFDRVSRGVRLTAAGELLFRQAERLFSVEAAAERELAELSGLRRGALSVGASTTIGSYLIPEVFGAFREAHQSVRLELEIANTAVIQSMVLENRIDLGLTEGFVEPEDLHVEVIHNDELVCIVAAGHALLQSRKCTLGELLAFPLLLRERGSGSRAVVEAALSSRGFAPEPAMALGSTEALKRAVAAGLGVAFVSRLTVERELEGGSLELLELEDCVIRRALHLITLSGKTPSPAVKVFVSMLRNALGSREAGEIATAIPD